MADVAVFLELPTVLLLHFNHDLIARHPWRRPWCVVTSEGRATNDANIGMGFTVALFRVKKLQMDPFLANASAPAFYGFATGRVPFSL